MIIVDDDGVMHKVVPVSVLQDILDKIRAEIDELWQNEPCAIEGGCLDEILEIIDKYKGESETEDGNNTGND